MDPRRQQILKHAARGKHGPQLQTALETHGIRFASAREVANYEDNIQAKGFIDNDARLTCNACGQFKSAHDKPHVDQGMLDLNYGN